MRKGTRLALSGNAAAAYAAKFARVGASPFFPIGPADEVQEILQELIDHGKLQDMEVFQLENEKAVVSCQIALARAGIRTLFATCAEGLFWPASEIKYAAGSRLPLLIASASRAVGPPTTMYCDHDDIVSQRDMGWLILFCETPQDVFDTVIQAYRVAEDRRVMLPVIVAYDGWEVSHGAAIVSLPEQEMIDRFLPVRQISPDKDYFAIDWHPIFKRRRYQWVSGEYMEKKYLAVQAMRDAEDVIEEVGSQYQELFGSEHTGCIQTHKCEDADIVVVTMGSMTGLVRLAVDALREKGEKIGLAKLRAYRPFPVKALTKALSRARVVIVLERNSLAVVSSELRAAFYASDVQRPLVLGRIVGIGGRLIQMAHVSSVLADGFKALETGKVEKELDWVPIKSLDFDPFEEEIGE